MCVTCGGQLCAHACVGHSRDPTVVYRGRDCGVSRTRYCTAGAVPPKGVAAARQTLSLQSLVFVAELQRSGGQSRVGGLVVFFCVPAELWVMCTLWGLCALALVVHGGDGQGWVLTMMSSKRNGNCGDVGVDFGAGVL